MKDFFEKLKNGAISLYKKASEFFLGLPKNTRYMVCGGAGVVLVLILIIALSGGEKTKAPVEIAFGTEPCPETDFEFVLNDSMTEVTITAYKGERRDLVFPQTIQGIPVVQIGSGSAGYTMYSGNMQYGSIFACPPFEDSNKESHFRVKSIVVPEGVKRIADYAFMGTQTSSGFNLESFDKIKLPSTLESIGNQAFTYTSFKEITIPENVKTIGKGAFRENKKLEKVILPGNLTAINCGTFSGTKALKEINFPSSLKIIEWYAFADSGITKLELNEGFEYLDIRAINECNKLQSLTLPSTLKYIVYGSSIRDLDSLDELNIPDLSNCRVFYDAGGALSGMDKKLIQLISGQKVWASIDLQKKLNVSFPKPTSAEENDVKKKYNQWFNCNYYADNHGLVF